MAISLLSSSVGNSGRNVQADVKLIQMLLNNWLRKSSRPPLKVDGIAGRKTISAVSDYQKSFGGLIDGRVDPGGPTLAALVALQGRLLTEGVSDQLRMMTRTLGYSRDAIAASASSSISDVLTEGLIKVKKQLG